MSHACAPRVPASAARSCRPATNVARAAAAGELTGTWWWHPRPHGVTSLER